MIKRYAPAIKRYALNLFAAGVIFAVWFTASQSYDPPHQTVAEGVPTPDLKALTIVDIVFKPDKGRIILALELPEKVTSGDLIADILETYRWSRSYYLPIKCGEDYPPQLCKIGRTAISLLIRSNRNIPAVGGGTVTPYAIRLVVWLDQVQIDKLLSQTPPETQNELFGFHQKVFEDTQGTGGFIQIYQDDPPLFPGLRQD